jgi:hypothetical protein
VYDRNRMILRCLLSDKLASGCGCLRALDAKRLIRNVVFAHLERAGVGLPAASRSAASWAARSAAALSRLRTRPARSSSISASKASSRFDLRRLDGILASPKRTSNTVIEVVQTLSCGCPSSQVTTVSSGGSRINADSTLVSSTTIRLRWNRYGLGDSTQV